MLSALSVFALVASYSHAQAQNSTSGNYSQPWRPQVHFSPPYGFMNGSLPELTGQHDLDPDGWQIRTALNPTGLTAGNQHWGHATSADLLTWTNQPIAISPNSSSEAIYTGSAVIDVNNTSGFFPDQSDGIMAMYTLNTATEQVQDIAYSADGGYTFTKYTGDPVISVGLDAFRDPKAIWYEATSPWVTAVSYANDDVISIWTSQDLKEWVNMSNFTQDGLTRMAFECPNMIPMPTVMNGSATDANDLLDQSNIISDASNWIMWISTSTGGPGGGSTSRYIAGTFNGTHFPPFVVEMRLTDFAMDNYAGQFYYNVTANQPQIGIQWASNTIYTNDVPTDSGGV